MHYNNENWKLIVVDQSIYDDDEVSPVDYVLTNA